MYRSCKILYNGNILLCMKDQIAAPAEGRHKIHKRAGRTCGVGTLIHVIKTLGGIDLISGFLTSLMSAEYGIPDSGSPWGISSGWIVLLMRNDDCFQISIFSKGSCGYSAAAFWTCYKT